MKHRKRDYASSVTINCRTAALAAVLLSCPLSAGIHDNLYLHGAVVAQPCVIPPGEEEFALDVGSIVDKYLYLHTRTTGKLFTLHLTGCDPGLVSTVRVTFSGTESRELPGMLAMDNGSQASGIALGLETPQGDALLLNQASERYPLQEGSNRIEIKAYVQGEPQAIAGKTIHYGPFSASATFSLEYE